MCMLGGVGEGGGCSIRRTDEYGQNVQQDSDPDAHVARRQIMTTEVGDGGVKGALDLVFSCSQRQMEN